MYNFLDLKLFPKISSNIPSTEDYGIENLVSDVYAKRIRGYIAYPSTKPPVEIECTFLCPINLFYLKLNTTVGTQKCTGIEVLAKNSSIPYTTICKAVYDKPGIIFCNSRRYSNESPPPSFAANTYHLAFFKSNMFRLFLNVTSVKIIIFRTEKSVPCLGAIEAWGIPSKFCSPQTVETINRILTKKNTSQNENFNSSNTKDTEFVIPDDFKDDLTYEIMTIPMTLPSGKTIDQSTLDKHIHNEASFGRKAGDPFTGLKFTDNCKPILNVALKSRIDMFLLHNVDKPQTFNLKRTLGRGNLEKSLFVVDNKKKCLNTESVNNDLETAIELAKKQPNFTCFTTDSKFELSCCKCKKDFHFYYKLPCLHYFCRLCILNICEKEQSICSVCDKLFSKSHVTKFNV